MSGGGRSVGGGASGSVSSRGPLTVVSRVVRVEFDATRIDRTGGRMTAPVTELRAGRDEFDIGLCALGVLLRVEGLGDQLLPMRVIRRVVLG